MEQELSLEMVAGNLLNKSWRWPSTRESTWRCKLKDWVSTIMPAADAYRNEKMDQIYSSTIQNISILSFHILWVTHTFVIGKSSCICRCL